MSATSSGTVTDDDAAVVVFVARLHAAAKAGRKLLEAAESGDVVSILGPMREARAAYDRLAEIAPQSAP